MTAIEDEPLSAIALAILRMDHEGGLHPERDPMCPLCQETGKMRMVGQVVDRDAATEAAL